MYTYDYPMFSYSVDIVIMNTDKTKVLVIERGKDPFKGKFAFPGGFVEQNETSIAAAYRELKEECGIGHIPALSFIGLFDGVNRDPRGRVISAAYGCLVEDIDTLFRMVRAGDDAANASLLDIKNPDHIDMLAFDHNLILFNALWRLR